MYKCKKCGYVHWLEEKPEYCPKCMSDTNSFVELNGKDKEKIEKTLYTNELLIELSDTLNKVVDIANDGLNENSEGSASELFAKIYKNGIEMVQMVKAQIEEHIKEGKWG